jgi:hypothetical protein
VWTERPKLSAAQVSTLLRTTTQGGVLDIPAALAAATPPNDPREPNDTVAEAAVEPPLTTKAHPSNRIAATLVAVKDPRDFYRIYVPKGKHVRLSVTGHVTARIVGSYALVTLRGASSASYVLSVTTG